MKRLPPIHGLLREAQMKRAYASQEAVAARSQTKDPRMAHECGERADRFLRQAEELDKCAAEDVDLVIQIETVAAFLRSSPTQSALRTLAMRKLEEASGCLRREIGDAVVVKDGSNKKPAEGAALQ